MSILSAGSRAVVPPLFHTLETLARTIYQATPQPGLIVTGPARSFLFEEAIRSVKGTQGIRLSRGTCAKMLAAVSMLEESGITAGQLAQELPSLAPHERLRLEGFVRYYGAFEKELRRAYAVDAPALFHQFREQVTASDLAKAFRLAFPDIARIALEGFDHFAEPEVEFVERLQGIPEVTVTIALGVVPGNPALSEHVEEHARRFQASGFERVDGDERVDPLGIRLFNRQTREASLDLSSRVTVVEARNRWHEVTAICRLLKRIVAEKPERELSTICVALPKPEIYTEIIRERFAAYGIPSNITDRFELSRSPLVMDIMGLLETRKNDFQRDDVLRILHSPLLSFENGIDRGNLIDISRRLRVTSGLDLWLRKIDAEIRYRESKQREVKESAGEEENDAFIHALRKARADLLMLEELTRDFEGELMPGEFESHVVALLRRLNLPGRLAAPGVAGEQAERDASAYARFMNLLHETTRIFQERPGERRHEAGVYSDALRSAIAGERYNVRERTGRGVLVTGLEETRGIPVEIMILAGMDDSSMPGVTEPEIFLSSTLQRKREEQRLQHARFLFYQAVTNWTEHLYITYPLRDAGVDLVSSSFLDAYLAVASVERVNDASPMVAGDAFFSEEEFLEWYAGWDVENRGQEGPLPHALREKAGRVRRGRQIERSRTATHEMGEYEGMIGGSLSSRASSVLRKVGTASFSVSDLETYGDCPFKFLAGNLLGLRSPAEFLEEISTIERGYVVHDVLFEFYRERQARALPPIRELSDKAFEDAVRELEEIAERRLSRIDIPGPFWELEKDYILGRAGAEPGLLRAFLMAERERTDRMVPAYFEVAFGQPGNRPDDADPRLSTPATVKIGEVNLRGRIDRIDVGEDCFTVTDYKTGSTVPTLSEIRSGTSLQLPLYLRAAEELLARKGRALPPAAGLYYRVRDQVELQLALGSARFSGEAFSAPRTTRRVLKTEAELEAIIDAAVQRANDYVDAMKAGEFPLARPEQRESVCRYCQFKTVCRVGSVREEREERGE